MSWCSLSVFILRPFSEFVTVMVLFVFVVLSSHPLRNEHYVNHFYLGERLMLFKLTFVFLDDDIEKGKIMCSSVKIVFSLLLENCHQTVK